MDLTVQCNNYANVIENALNEWANTLCYSNSQVGEAAKYSLLNGGKRIRGILTLATCKLLSLDYKKAIDYAVAVEIVHCYSLIHDDLPCMDNDDFRRGKPSCHKAFNEENALLAGDALLTLAFEVIANCKLQPAENNIKAIQHLSRSAGPKGMIYGQELDLFQIGRAHV